MCSRKGSRLGRTSFGTDEGSPEHVLQRSSETTFGSWKISLEGIPKGIECKGSFLGVRPEGQGLTAHRPRSMGGSRKDPDPRIGTSREELTSARKALGLEYGFARIPHPGPSWRIPYAHSEPLFFGIGATRIR